MRRPERRSALSNAAATERLRDRRVVSDLPPQNVQRTGGVLEGVNWRFASSSLRFVTQLIVTTILAHLLFPKDLGLLGMAVVVVAFATLVAEFGIGPALVQHSNLTSAHIRVGFTLSLIIGTLVAVIVWVAAPSVAVLFQDAEIIPVLRLLSLWPLLESLGIASRSILLRNLDFKRQFWVDTCGNLVGYAAVSIGLALLGYGVWAPAVGVIARSSVTSATLLFMAPPPSGPLLARREVLDVLRFGLGVSVTRLAHYGATNADYVVVGTWMGAEALGFYQYAYQLAYLPITFVTAELSFVLFPTLAAIRGEPQRLQSVYRGALGLVSLIALPSAVAIAISAPDLVPVILGDRWARSIVPLRILCIAAIFHALYNLSDSLVRAAGAVYQQATRHLVYAVAVLGCSMLGLAWSLTGVSIGVAAAIVLISVLMVSLSIRLSEVTWLQFLKAQFYPGLVALAVGAGGVMGSMLGQILELRHLGSLVLILVGCGVGALVGVLVLFTGWLGSDIREVLIDAAHLVPYERMRSWLCRKLEGRETIEWLLTAKNWARYIPGLQRVWQEGRLLVYAVREGMWRAVMSSYERDKASALQRVLTWDVPLPPVTSVSELEQWLREHDIAFQSGWHTLYLPPQGRLGDALGNWVSLYPPDAGFKILKDLRPPEKANYVRREAGGPIEASLVGIPSDQLVTANFLYANRCSPRVYDLICLRSELVRYSAFVVQHIVGSTPSEEDYRGFLARLAKLMDKTELRTTHPVDRTVDFEAPTCNGNLLVAKESGESLYIDFQTFRLRNPSVWCQDIVNAGANVLHFGDEHALCGGRYLYQSVPGFTEKGKRNISRRWAVICEQLRRNGLKIDGRLVLDVGCNSGMVIAQALYDGALWGIGWDLPSVVAYAEPLLLSLGLTRFNLIAAKLDRMYPLHNDIPDHLLPCLSESIVFYLAVRQHIGFMDSLSRLSWRILVYEGHEREGLEGLEDDIRELRRRDIKIVSRTYIADGFSGRRPLAVFVRD